MNPAPPELLLLKPGNPARVYGSLAGSLHAIEPPVWAAVLAACAREKGHSVRILDAEAEGLGAEAAARSIAEASSRLCGIIVSGANLSASTWIMPAASAYATALKKAAPGLPVFFWGLHPAALPERTLREEACDYVINGEGLSTVTELLATVKAGAGPYPSVKGLSWLEGGRYATSGKSPIAKNLDLLPPPAWDLLPMEKYRAHNWHCFNEPERRSPYASIYTSLGCPFHCDFCALNTLFENRPGVRFRSPRLVVDEIALLNQRWGVRNIKLLDECFVLNPRHVNAICDLLIERRLELNLWAYARIDTVSPELLAKLRKAGMRWLAYGIESGDDQALGQVSKGQYDLAKIRQVIRQTKEADISVCGNFMFGLPGDTRASMQATLDLALELNCEYTNFYTTMAYPGSGLYARALANPAVKLPESWGGYSQYAEDTLPLATETLTPGEVLRFRDEAFRVFHSSPGYLAHMEKRFGAATVAHLRDMLGHTLKRKAYS